MTKWKTATIPLAKLENHLNELSTDGYEVFDLYPVRIAETGLDELASRFLVVASTTLAEIPKAVARVVEKRN